MIISYINRAQLSGGGVSGTVPNHRKKTRCGHCGRPIAVDNRKHALSSACVAYASKHKTGTLYSANVIDVFNTSRSSSLYINSDEEDTSRSAVVQYEEGDEEQDEFGGSYDDQYIYSLDL